jgi:hypothetical protein
MQDVCLVHCLMALCDLLGLLKVELPDKVLGQLFVFVGVTLKRFRRVRKIAKDDCWFRHMSVRLSACNR